MKYYLIVFISIILALILDLVSLSHYIEYFRPHFLLMTVIYWALYTKKQFSIFSAWLTGLLLDIALNFPLGASAFSFAICVFIIKRNKKWLEKLSIQEQSLAFAGFYILQIVFLLIINKMVGRANDFEFLSFGSVITSMIFFPVIYTLLHETCHIFEIPRQ